MAPGPAERSSLAARRLVSSLASGGSSARLRRSSDTMDRTGAFALLWACGRTPHGESADAIRREEDPEKPSSIPGRKNGARTPRRLGADARGRASLTGRAGGGGREASRGAHRRRNRVHVRPALPLRAVPPFAIRSRARVALALRVRSSRPLPPARVSRRAPRGARQEAPRGASARSRSTIFPESPSCGCAREIPPGRPEVRTAPRWRG